MGTAKTTRPFVSIELLLRGELLIEYRGTPNELVAMGAVTYELLQPLKGGQRRVDADGDSCRICKRYPSGAVAVLRYKTPERALELGLPGVAAWLREHPIERERKRIDALWEFHELQPCAGQALH